MRRLDALNSNTFNVLVVIAVFSMFFMRPSFFGESYNFFGCLVFCLASLGIFLLGNVSSSLFKAVAFRVAPLILMWTYFLIHAGIKGVISPFPSYSFILCLVTGLGSIFIFSTKGAAERFIFIFVIALAVLGLSSAISFVLSLFIPLDKMQLTSFVSPTYGAKSVFFPFSIGYDVKFYPFATTQRFSMFWREAGIAQAIYCWAILVATQFEPLRARRWVIPSLIAGVVVSQSTIAYANLAVTICAWVLLFSKSKISVRAVVVVCSIPVSLFLFYFAIFDENIGLASKIDGASSLDRLNAILNSLSYLSDDPWGYGIYGDSGVSAKNSGINLIGAAAAIGVPGLFFVIFFWGCAIFFSDRKLLRFFALLPIMTTAITSQPLLDSFAVWIIFVAPTVLRWRDTG